MLVPVDVIGGISQGLLEPVELALDLAANLAGLEEP
jgi:hypothetical protein